VVTVIVDITLRKRAEAERDRLIAALRRSNRDLDQFAYVASHDLKAPLRGVANLAHFIEDDLKGVMPQETRKQMQEVEGRLPDSLIACIGGGSNAMGLFHPFLDDPSVEIFGVEAAGHGLTQLHAASIAGGRPGVLHGNRTYLLMDDDGQIQDAHSISAGLDYPAASLAFVAIKDERRLEVYARASEGDAWRHVRDYPVLAASGRAGPKLRQGDRQVPEGVYRIELLNPNSRYHLSLRRGVGISTCSSGLIS
jgi:hypothetical protein